MTTTTARIDEIEARLAQQDQSVLELSDEVYRQQQHIARLEKQLRTLRERLDALATRDPLPSAPDETPPHY